MPRTIIGAGFCVARRMPPIRKTAARMADEFEDLVEGLEGEAREARLRLLRELTEQGCTHEELREAVKDDRLVLLPVERALQGDPVHTVEDVAETSGLDPDDLRKARVAFGLPLPDDGGKVFTDEDVEVAKGLKAVLDSGVPLERINELNRIIGRAMLQVAAASRAMIADVLAEPGANEHDVALRWATAARELMPRMRPTLAYAYEAHLRELIRSDVISAADIAAGRRGGREMAVAFADLVGFTRLGEEVPPEELGEVVRRMEERAAELVEKPVTFVKTIGDAVMLVSPDSDPLIDVATKLVDAMDESEPLRVGIACGTALERGGDWYGSPVNQASRVTQVARPGSVLATESVKEHANGDWKWSFARERKLKGVGEVKLYRVRRADAQDEG
jgi:adenylate cyclase